MESIREQWNALVKARKRQMVLQVLNLGMVLSAALIIYKIAIVLSNSESPIVVVLSESMEPGIRRGDLLVLSNWNTPYKVGDIVVYKIHERPVPIVHRIIRVHADGGLEALILTKGDNNFGDDVSLYASGQVWLERKHIVGKARAMLPYAGMLTIKMNEYPKLKVGLLGSLSLFALINGD